MTIKVTQMAHIKDTDFKALARKQTSLQMKMRLLALAHFQDGHSRTQIAQFLKVSITGHPLIYIMMIILFQLSINQVNNENCRIVKGNGLI